MVVVSKDIAVPFSTIHILTESLARVPEELICHVIQFLDPHELIGLQKVSRQFHAIVNDAIVWRTMYRNARLPRPPGPFSWQSMPYLKRTLVRSAQLAHTWTSQPMKFRVESSRRILAGLEDIDEYKWVSQRWFLWGGGTKDIMSYDVTTGTQQTLWNAREGPVSCWQACSSVSAQGHLIYVALRAGSEDHQVSAKLLEFRLDEDSVSLSGPIVFDIPGSILEEPTRICAASANAEWVYVSIDPRERLENALVFDIRARHFYRFPAFRSQLTDVHSSSPFHLSFDRSIGILLTRNHIFAAFHFHPDNLNTTTARLVQAFAIPDAIPSGNWASELSLSHETIHQGPLLSLSLIRNSVVNPVDGSTNIRFMRSESGARQTFFCTEFSLPRSRPDAILPISINIHEIFMVNSCHMGEYFQTSDDGFVRGFCMDTCISGDHYSLYRFTIDATGERCVAVVGDRSSPGPEAGVEFAHSLLLINWFDGERVCCYTKEQNDTPETEPVAPVTYVVELA